MRTAVSYWFGFLIPCEERLRMIRNAGFSDVLLWWGDDLEDANGPKEALADAVYAKGLGVESAHLPYINANLLWEDTADAHDLSRFYTDLIRSAAFSNVPILVMHLTYGDTPPPPNALGLERMKHICEVAEKTGVVLAVENIRVNAHIEYIFDHIPSEDLKFCYDSGHEHCHKDSNLLERFGSRLATVHLHDNNGFEDQHLIPGYGTIKWQNVVSELRRLGYIGSVALEVSDSQKISAESFLKYAYTSACGLADMLKI